MAEDLLGDDLAAYLDGYDESWDDTEPPGVPEDVEEAHRLLMRLRWRERELERIAARAEREIAPMVAWRDDRSAGVRREIERISRSLSTWMLAHQKLTGVRTEKFPSGELRAWAAKARLVVFDDEAAAEQIEDQRPAWVRTKKEIVKAEVTKATVPGKVILRANDPPPDGYEWRELHELLGWEGSLADLGIIRPLLRQVPYMALLWPTRPTFSYKTTKPRREEPDGDTED
jgi:phage host-nuclease inhibitor protein Gam